MLLKVAKRSIRYLRSVSRGYFVFSQEKFSARLVQLRVNTGLSQAALAKEIGLGRSAVSLMEIGERAGSIEALCALADYFDVSLDYLIGRSDDPVRR